MSEIESINTTPKKSSYKSKKNEMGGILGTMFMFISIILCVAYLVSVLVKKENSNGIKITTLVCWVIFGIFFSYILFVNKSESMNFGISFFVILVSCMLTCRQINVIKTCII